MNKVTYIANEGFNGWFDFQVRKLKIEGERVRCKIYCWKLKEDISNDEIPFNINDKIMFDNGLLTKLKIKIDEIEKLDNYVILHGYMTKPCAKKFIARKLKKI